MQAENLSSPINKKLKLWRLFIVIAYVIYPAFLILPLYFMYATKLLLPEFKYTGFLIEGFSATIMASLCYAWYFVDAKLQNYKRDGLGFLIFLLAVLVLPYYFIKTRGVKKGVLCIFIMIFLWVAQMYVAPFLFGLMAAGVSYL